MVWRNIVYLICFAGSFFLMMNPEVCSAYSVCREARQAIVVILTGIAVVILFWDRKALKQAARDKVFGKRRE